MGIYVLARDNRILLGLVLLGCLLAGACGPEKKKARTEAEQEEYDYRGAIQQYKIGINYLNNQQPLQAIEHLNNAIEQDGNNFRYQHALGLAFSMNGQLDEALVALNKALAINPGDSETYNLLGSIYTDLRRYDEAVECFKKVIQDRSYAEPQFAYFNLGLCMQAQKKYTEAIAAFSQTIRVDPEFHRAYLALANLHKQEGDWKKALFYYQKAEPAYPNKVDVLFEIGRAMFKLRQFDKAKSYLAQVSILFPPPNIDGPTQDMLRYIEKYEREARN